MINRILPLAWLLAVGAFAATPPDKADDFRARSGFAGDIIVHLDSNASRLSIDLAKGDNVLFHALESDAAALAATRELLFTELSYGQKSAIPYDGKALPYADNLVNMIVCETETTVPEEELLRALRPLGTAFIDGKTIVKPWPKDIDEWNHFLHGPDNNAVARDKRVNQPRSLQ